ncbi:MAG: 2-oxoacid:acceptor oxidoreductase subunit alpha [Alphaproteobacteria bacterium]|nr:2-oxoacid:acceptor oxidoreductase subunit alpha [Alphaproteobacteria bacterium]
MASNHDKNLFQKRETIDAAVVRFAGDSGDGIQILGKQFTQSTALAGNDLATFQDFPAEIRAPAGSASGVSAFQINFGSHKTQTIGDNIDILFAMNPAALKVNLSDLRDGGLIIIDENCFTTRDLAKAGYDVNPLDDHTLDHYRLMRLPLSNLTIKAVKTEHISIREARHARNMWALGLALWMFDREKTTVTDWIRKKFAGKTHILEANLTALDAGFAYADVTEYNANRHLYHVPEAPIETGLYRNVTGTETLCWGLVTGAMLANLKMVYCSYPITPASDMLHLLTGLGEPYNIIPFQAEDEIASVCAAIGASYAGHLGVTGSSGPGMALKSEAISLAVATELPLVIINAQRGGPSTGLPTKTEQADLYQAIWGRSADTPLVVLAPRSPSACFSAAIEAVELAITFMTPVILLTDGYLSNASEAWKIPDIDAITPFPVKRNAESLTPPLPYSRDPETLARPWLIPGMKGKIHRIGGLERQNQTGNVSYDPQNHHEMTLLRHNKIAGIANRIPRQKVEYGPDKGLLAIVGWGSTFGPIHQAVRQLTEQEYIISHIHLHHIWPLPGNLGTLLSCFEFILIPEMNMGQLATLLRSAYSRPIISYPKVTGQPFKISEIVDAALKILEK